jgi:hypothetical protein
MVFILSFATLIILFLVIKVPLLEDDGRLYSLQVSESENESKENKLFIAEYDFYPKIIKAKNKQYKIKEIWAEKRWMYEDEKNKGKSFWSPYCIKTPTKDLTIKEKDGNQLVFIFNPDLRNYLRIEYKDTLNGLVQGTGRSNDNVNKELPKRESDKDTIFLYLFEDEGIRMAKDFDDPRRGKFITELKLIKK